jgi:protein-tyrosine phosphatase
MNTLKNRINLKIQIPKAATKEEPQKINLNDSNQATKSSISKITDNIYISGYIIGKNIPYLKSNDFTHVINCCVGSSLCSSDDNTDEQSLKQLYERNNIKYLSIYLRDDPEVDIFYHFFQVINFLESEEKKGDEKILFHCKEGISRAPAMVAGYLMWKKKYNFNEVIDLIKSKRNCVDINLGFNIQLNKWENYLINAKKNKKIFDIVKPNQNIVVIMKK